MTTFAHEHARRFGLDLQSQPSRVGLRRHGETAWFSDAPPRDDIAARHASWVRCLGVRLGLDLRAAKQATRGLGDLEWVQRLYPEPAIDLAAAIAEREIPSSSWVLGGPFRIVSVRETGKLRVIATSADRVVHDDARRALFYQAYKLRPSESVKTEHGKLTTYQTTDGLASSVASLFCEFDFDTARDRGVLLMPDYNRVLAFRPADSVNPWSWLRATLRSEVSKALLPLSRRLYSLRRDRIIPAEVCGTAAELDAARLVTNLLEVSA